MYMEEKKKRKKNSFYYFHILFNLNYNCNKFSPYLSSFSIELYSFLFLEFFFLWGEEAYSGATHKG